MKKKIAVIGVKGLPGYGGSARANNEILTRLVNEFDITVYALDTHAKVRDYKGLKQHIFKSYTNLKISALMYFIKSVLHALFIGKYDMIHCNHGVSGFITPLLKLRYKVITSIRGLNFSNDDKWNSIEFRILRLAEWISFNLSEVVTTVQKSSINHIKSRTKREVKYIPNGVSNHYKLYSKVDKLPVITHSAARLIYLKGVHDFLKALRLLDFSDKIRIIGDLNHVKSYKEKILDLSLGLNVEFTGLIKDQKKLFHLISSSSLYVFPSHSEGMSNMLLEVASLKVPIIASDIPANTDVFDDGEVVFFRKGDYHDLAEKINELWNNEVKREKFAESAYSRVIKDYDWDKIAENYRKLYIRTLN